MSSNTVYLFCFYSAGITPGIFIKRILLKTLNTSGYEIYRSNTDLSSFEFVFGLLLVLLCCNKKTDHYRLCNLSTLEHYITLLEEKDDRQAPLVDTSIVVHRKSCSFQED